MGNHRNWKKSNERDGRGGAERRGSRRDDGHARRVVGGGLLLSTVWIKTNGAPRLSSQPEKHQVGRAAPRRLLSVTCHHQPEPRRNTAETLTHTLSAGVGGGGGCDYCIYSRALVQTAYMPSPWQRHVWPDGRQCTGCDLTHFLSALLSAELLVFSPAAVIVFLKMWETFHVSLSPPLPSPLLSGIVCSPT